MTTSTKLKPADSIHFLGSITFPASDNGSTGHTSRRGQVIVLTRTLLDAQLDRNNASWLDMVDDPDAQTRRWGSVMFGRGSFPANLSVWVPGTIEWATERERRRTAAQAIADEQDRARALRAVNDEFGPAVSGQRSTTYAGSTNLPQQEA